MGDSVRQTSLPKEIFNTLLNIHLVGRLTVKCWSPENESFRHCQDINEGSLVVSALIADILETVILTNFCVRGFHDLGIFGFVLICRFRESRFIMISSSKGIFHSQYACASLMLHTDAEICSLCYVKRCLYFGPQLCDIIAQNS